MFEIEKNVPLEEKPLGPGRPPLYPFAVMEIGDSFFAAGKTLNSVSACASIYKKSYGKKFSCKSYPDGIRVWRIA